MITFDEALTRLARTFEPLDTHTISLDSAAGRFLAADISARLDAPRFDVSVMDGYAVAEETITPGEWHEISGEARPGAGVVGKIEAGRAIRIFTGAPIPHGADRVIMQEYAECDAGRVRFLPSYGRSRHVRERSSDFEAGSLLVSAGTRLTPQAMVTVAAADVAEIEVYRSPCVAIIATGDEVAEPGSAHLSPHALPDSITSGILTLIDGMGGETVSKARGCDSMENLAQLAGEALRVADCVVVTGGASVGDHDLARPMFAEHGLEEIFSRVAMKPGKPVWLGRAKEKPVLGLPGNPTSAAVCGRLFLRPLLARLQGGSIGNELSFISQPLAAPLPATGARETFWRAESGPSGLLPVSDQASSRQAPLARSNWLVRTKADDPAYATGDLVDALAF